MAAEAGVLRVCVCE